MIRYRAMQETGGLSPDAAGHQNGILRMFQELMAMQPGLPDELQMAINSPATPVRCADAIADAMNFSYAEKLLVLTAPNVETRFEMLAVLLNRELECCRMGLQIQSEVQEAMGASQREFYLREQLKAIKQELGEFSNNSDVVELTEKMEKTQLPDIVRETIQKELERLELLPQNAPEYHISYNYMNTMLSIPWMVFSQDHLDCKDAGKILDADHFGLEDVKSRILEFLAVMQRRSGDKNCRAPIL
jgi:ATP-dependent Lon protease